MTFSLLHLLVVMDEHDPAESSATIDVCERSAFDAQLLAEHLDERLLG